MAHENDPSSPEAKITLTRVLGKSKDFLVTDFSKQQFGIDYRVSTVGEAYERNYSKKGILRLFGRQAAGNYKIGRLHFTPNRSIDRKTVDDLSEWGLHKWNELHQPGMLPDIRLDEYQDAELADGEVVPVSEEQLYSLIVRDKSESDENPREAESFFYSSRRGLLEHSRFDPAWDGSNSSYDSHKKSILGTMPEEQTLERIALALDGRLKTSIRYQK